MWNVLQSLTRARLMLLLCFLFVVGLVQARFLLSVCFWGFAILAVFEVQWRPKIRLGFNPMLKSWRQRFKSYPEFIMVTCLFWLYLVSVFWSGDHLEWLVQMRLKVPFLIMPLSFLFLPPLSRKQYHSLFYWLLLCACISALGVVWKFYGAQEMFIDEVREGRAFPTPINHIRYSLLGAIAVAAGVVLVLSKFYLFHRVERLGVAVMTGFLFLFIHLLSVRSGLVAMYGALAVLGIYFVVKEERYKLGIWALVALFFAPFIAYRISPSFKQKVNYTVYDYKQYRQGVGSDYSDSDRIRSWKTGLDLAHKHFLIGIGAGDLKPMLSRYYRENFHSDRFWKPHNQFITVYLVTGVIGLFIFLISLYVPLLVKSHWKEMLLLLPFVICMLSMLAENTLDTSRGSALYLFFILIGFNHLIGRHNHVAHT